MYTHAADADQNKDDTEEDGLEPGEFGLNMLEDEREQRLLEDNRDGQVTETSEEIIDREQQNV